MTDDQQRNPVSVTLKCQLPIDNGTAFGFDLTVECLIGHIPGIVQKLLDAGVTPAQTPYTWDASKAAQNPPQTAPQDAPVVQAEVEPTPYCPVHQRPMKVSNHGGWFCTAKIAEGQFCQEKAAA